VSMSNRPSTATSNRPSPLLCDRISASAREHANAIALISADQSITYLALGQRANRLARLLIALGVGTDDVIPIAFESSVDRIVAILGILAAGAVYLPLDTEAPPSRVNTLIDGVKASLVLTSAEFTERLGLERSERVLVIGDPQPPRLDSRMRR